jgi:hypothetical protein
VNVRTAVIAAAQAKAIDVWWRSNRLAAPDLFADELAQATSLISDLPKAGRVTRRGGLTSNSVTPRAGVGVEKKAARPRGP